MSKSDLPESSARDQVSAAKLEETVRELRQALLHQSRLTEALFQILAAKWDLEEEDLEAMVEKLKAKDLAGGSKISGPCPKCAEPLKEGRPTCFWCGAKVAGGVFSRTY